MYESERDHDMDVSPVGDINAFLWRHLCFAAGMVILLWIVAAFRGQMSGSVLMCCSWSGCCGFILGMWVTMAVSRNFK
jgi:hypothetical protein